MINLLPEPEKKELKMMLVYRRTVLVLFLFFIFLLVLIDILFVLRMFLLIKVEELNSQVLLKEDVLRQTRLQNFRKIITIQNDALNKIQKLWREQVFFTPLFEKLSRLKGEGISFENISLQKQPGMVEFEGEPQDKFKQAAARVSGFAKTRENLLAFLNAMEEDDNISEIKFLPSLWDKPRNINFSFDLKFIASVNL